jgi:uncharacterized protein DUF5655
MSEFCPNPTLDTLNRKVDSAEEEPFLGLSIFGRQVLIPVAEIRDWNAMWTRAASLLEKQTGVGVATWNERIRKERFEDEASLRAWLTKQGVKGYGQDLLVMERFGYPDFFTATAQELIDGQYVDRPHLRPIFGAIVKAVEELADVTIQARKTYVSLVSTRRTFARIVPTTRNRVDLGLRLEGVRPRGRLQPSKIHETMQVQVRLTSPDQVDSQVLAWLRRAYEENR